MLVLGGISIKKNGRGFMTKIAQVFSVTLLCVTSYVFASDVDDNKKEKKSNIFFNNEKIENNNQNFIIEETFFEKKTLITEVKEQKNNLLQYVEKIRLCGQKAFEKNVDNGQYFRNGVAFVLEELEQATQFPSGLKKPLKNFQNLICGTTFDLKEEEEVIDSIFTQQLVREDEKEMGWKGIFEKEKDQKLTDIRIPKYLVLALNFLLKKGFVVKKELFQDLCYYDRLSAIKLILNKGKESSLSFLNEKPVDYVEVFYRNAKNKELEGQQRSNDRNSQEYLDIMIMLVQKGASISGLEEDSELFKILQSYVIKSDN